MTKKHQHAVASTRHLVMRDGTKRAAHRCSCGAIRADDITPGGELELHPWHRLEGDAQ